MSAEPVDNVVHLARRASEVERAMRRHPSSGHFTVDLPSLADPAGAITQVAREWERIHRDLTAGPGALPDEDGYEVLQVMVAALVHRTARAGLVFTWTKVLAAVKRLDQVMDSDLEPFDVGCTSYAEAVAKANTELAWELYPLVHGLPSRDACSDCVRTHASVTSWQPRLGCTQHIGGR